MAISQVPKQDMKNLALALRTRMSTGSLPQLPAVDLQDSAVAANTSADADGTAARQQDPVEQLARLAELRDQGVITPEDFEVAKQRLLGNL